MTLSKVYNGKSIDEVVKLLGEYGGDAKVIAGGTDIVIALKNEKISPKVLIDISKIDELKKIEDDGQYITIGGATTFTQIVESPLFLGNLHGFHKACRMVGSPQIRNKGTIGGNIANGSSAADAIPPLISLASVITLVSQEGVREILLEDYYNEQIKENELLTKIKFKKPNNNQILTFAKLGLRKALAISRLTISMSFNIDNDGIIKDIKVASGAIGKYPMREHEVEDFLRSKKIDEKNIKDAIEAIQNSMDERLKGRSTLPYKRIAVKSMIREAMEPVLEFVNGVKS